VDDVVARDPRVEAILTRPDDYFARARSRAWAEAARDIRNELDRRHSSRRNGAAAAAVRLETRLADVDGPARGL
jgi:hypothetical protein